MIPPVCVKDVVASSEPVPTIWPPASVTVDCVCAVAPRSSVPPFTVVVPVTAPSVPAPVSASVPASMTVPPS